MDELTNSQIAAMVEDWPYHPDHPDLSATQMREMCESWEPTNADAVAGPSESSEKSYEILAHRETNITKFNAVNKSTLLKIKENSEGDPETYLKKVFTEIVADLITCHSNPCDRIGVTILGEGATERPVYLSYRMSDQYTAEVLLNQFQRVLQSNADFLGNAPMKINVSRIIMPQGMGKGSKFLLLPFEEFCRQKRSILLVNNTEDSLCLPRALVLAIAHANREADPAKYTAFRKSDRQNELKVAAEALCQEAGVSISSNGSGVEELQLFQNHLTAWNITVFDGNDRRGRKVIFEGKNPTATPLDLIYAENHFNVLTSLSGAFNFKFFCRKCRVGYDHISSHRCKDIETCPQCLNAPPCPVTAVPKDCVKCHRIFRGQSCFDNHVNPHPYFERNKSVCHELRFCKKCLKQYSSTLMKGKAHKCGHYMCHNCGELVPNGHMCFIQPLKPPNYKKEKPVFAFFDLECRVASESLGENTDSKPHIPNFCVLQHQCMRCISDLDLENFCTECGDREKIISGMEGDDLLEELFSSLVNLSTHFGKVYIFAHNGGGYDYQFVVDYMIRKKSWTPSIILNGGKIMQLSKDRLVFKDTLNYFHAPLSALPKMFGLQNTEKGYFPHKFNIEENQNYIGELPALHFYTPDDMKVPEREKFLTWHREEKEKNEIFNFKHEIEKYCRDDVRILRKATLIFRNLFLNQLRVDPLISSCTVASACMSGYRLNFLPGNTLPLMNFKSYRMRDTQSELALRYIRYFEEKYQVELESAWRGVEKRIGKYPVDGYCSTFPLEKLNPDASGTRALILEIHGCYFHGCPRCFPNRTSPLSAGKNSPSEPITMESRYQNTLKKMQYLEQLPTLPVIIEKWECQLYHECGDDPELKKYLTDPHLITPILNNREAFYGGRTETFYRHYEANREAGEEIRYLDVNSLYPYVNKYGIYPIGHPEVLLGNSIPVSLNGLTGVAKVRILPPTNLYLPVLPVRVNNKLIFGLCFTCAAEENHSSCSHPDELREIVGTYTCPELVKATQKGYRILEIIEVWSYKSTQYNKNTKKGGLFSGYIDLFLKIKQEASGFPANVTTDAQKDAFIKELKDREGVELEIAKVTPNPGLRSLSKLCLNSLWGKFGQRNNMGQTTLIESGDRLFEYLADASKEISNICFVRGDNEDNDVAYVNWKHLAETAIDKDFINPIVCAYVTAQARLLLYSYMEQLKDRLLYCDTDSIIFVHRQGDPEIPTGPFLGQMGDELEPYGEGAYISEFVSGGPKNYGYCVVTGNGEKKHTIKVRGITLNHRISNQLNFDAMKRVVLAETPEVIKASYPNKIQRKRLFKVVTQPITKRYGEVGSKRRRVGHKTLPYGYVDPTQDVEDEDEI